MRKVSALVVGLVIMLVAFSTALGSEPSQVEIGKLTHQMARVNTQLSNPDLVMPGDTVRVPVQDGYMTYAVQPWMVTAEKGCLWQIAKLHLSGKIQPINSSISSIPADPPSGNSLWHWLFLLGFLLVLLLLLGVIIYANKRRKNPANYPPVVSDGLSVNPEEALSQIRRNYPQMSSVPIGRVERGRLVRNSGPRRIPVRMEFGDNRQREIHLKSGDEAYRVTATNGTIHYFMRHCGNHVAAVASGQFQLSEGWEFRVSATHEVAPSAPADPPAANSTATPTATPTAEKKPESGQEAPKTAEPQSGPKKVEIEIGDGNSKLIISAQGDVGHMPTKIEHAPGKTIIFFPRGE
jgi:hypothetical protein